MVVETKRKHPAKFNDDILRAIYPWTFPSDRILDPFAGTGRVHLLNGTTVGVEIEPEWAEYHEDTIVGDALHLPFDDGAFDAIVTSPCYGNRMADAHNAQDRCKQCAGWGYIDNVGDRCKSCDGTGLSRRNTYKAYLGRHPTTGSSATMQWGAKYRAFHNAAWTEALRVLKGPDTNGRVILNVKDHIRAHRVQPVADWHHNWFLQHGMVDVIKPIRIPLAGNRQGENGETRVDCEWVYVMRRVS